MIGFGAIVKSFVGVLDRAAIALRLALGGRRRKLCPVPIPVEARRRRR